MSIWGKSLGTSGKGYALLVVEHGLWIISCHVQVLKIMGLFVRHTHTQQSCCENHPFSILLSYEQPEIMKPY